MVHRFCWHLAFACYFASCLLGVAGCGSDTRRGDDADQVSPSQTAARRENLDPLHPVVMIDTTLGEIRVQLDAVNAPGTVRNFLNYVGDGFYTNTRFHYVDSGKMILGGGYSADGQLKPARSTVRNEAHNGLKNVRGSVAMARDSAAGIDSASSQFFINLADAPTLDHRGESADEYGYCVFGEVVGGLDVAEKISRSATRDQGGDLAKTPQPPVIIKSIAAVE
jgi:cyclophilin family peptidyl-prolyl cis-trans isomerase